VDLVAEPAQEGRVGDVLRHQVRREHEHDVERQRELRAAVQREVVVVPVHRTIQRFINCSGVTIWRPRSSTTKSPLFAFTCGGAW